MHGCELHDVFMVKFTQKEDFPDGCRGDTVSFLKG
jgi:hypothetical protein